MEFRGPLQKKPFLQCICLRVLLNNLSPAPQLTGIAFMLLYGSIFLTVPEASELHLFCSSMRTCNKVTCCLPPK